MTHLHETLTSSQLAFRAIPHVPVTQVTAPNSALAGSSCMHANILHDKDMNNSDTTAKVVDNDTRTPLIKANQCMLTSDTNSHNPSLIYPNITTHHCA